jgi:hypothetical protein
MLRVRVVADLRPYEGDFLARLRRSQCGGAG